MTQEEIQEFTDWKLAKKQQEEAEKKKKAEENRTVDDWLQIMNESYNNEVGKVNLNEE